MADTPPSFLDPMSDIDLHIHLPLSPLLFSSPLSSPWWADGGLSPFGGDDCFAENGITDAPAPSYATLPTISQPVDELAPTPNIEQPAIVYPKLARGGGNKKHVKQSTRQIDVQIKNGIAQWTPRKGYWKQIVVFKKFLDKLPTEVRFSDGVEHPLFGVNSVRMTGTQSKTIARQVYPTRQTPEKAFGQLMCYLGMRSDTDKKTKVRTLAFDRQGWNEMGYRLVKNGDAKGGKPKINYIPV